MYWRKLAKRQPYDSGHTTNHRALNWAVDWLTGVVELSGITQEKGYRFPPSPRLTEPAFDRSKKDLSEAVRDPAFASP